MNAISEFYQASELVMSSKEIAELCDKRHDNVLRDVKKMLSELGKDLLNFEGIWEDSYGRNQKIYLLPKNLTITLVAGYSVRLRVTIIDRWQELEGQAANGFQVPRTMAEALRLAADQAEQIESQRHRIQQMTPAAELGKRVAESDRSVMRFVRTLPGVNTQQVHKRLACLGYLYKRKGTWRVKRSRTRYFDERIIEGVKLQIKIIATGDGQKLLASLYNTGKLPMKLNCRVEMVSFENDGTLTHKGKQGSLL